MMFDQCRWLNEPREWQADAEALRVVTDERSDFWRETHYGFTRDSGHFYGRTAPASFSATLRVQGQYRHLYDQAGLMVRLDAAHWIKAGIELSDGEALISSVLTLGRSDWATGRFWGDAADFWLRVTVAGGALRLQASADGKLWPLLRLCPFPERDSYEVGPMCGTPERAGLQVRFSEFTVGPPSGKDLHDLS